MRNSVANEVLGSFLEEARQSLPAMRQSLDALVLAPDDAAALSELHRLAHNLRGASHVIGMPEIGQLAEGLEDLLGQIAEGAIVFDAEIASLVAMGLEQMEGALQGAAAPIPGAAGRDVASDLVGGFLIEAEENLNEIGPQLKHVDRSPEGKAILREIRRGVHTIKGAAAMVGLPVISQLAHRMEDLLDQLWEGVTELTPDCHHLLSATYDTLSDLVQAGGNGDGLEGRIAGLYATYESLLAAASDAPQPAILREPAAAEPEPVPEAAAFVRVPAERLDELMRLVAELFVERSIFEQQLHGLSAELSELGLTQQRLRRLSTNMESQEASLLPASVMSGASPTGGDRPEFDALEFDRYTQIHLLSRDLNETGADVRAAAERLQDFRGSFDAYLRRHSRLISEVQDRITRAQMVPFDSIVARLQRTARVTAELCGKDVELTIDGGSMELDQTVLARLAGPLEHLLRNAVDHGVEDPARRAAAGKPERARIHLDVTQEGTDVVLRLSDDGRGLDHAKLRREAVRQGFLQEEDAAAATPEQLYEFVFESGFSTAGQISEISGRGVGLDVVKATVESLRGVISLQSEPGQGATFSLRLPMRMAIAKILMVEVQGQRYALPLQAITEVGRVEARNWERRGDELHVHLSGRVVRAHDLAVQLGMRDPYDPRQGRLSVVALRVGHEEFALIVDDIFDAREVAVKSLSGMLSRLRGVAGATILGDGTVILILNPAELRSGAVSTPVVKRAAPVVRRALDVMIVDDSLSVRRVVAGLIRNTGWNAMQAKDGVEALELLGLLERVPDIMLLDVEMPRMDGFELTTRLRASDRYRNLPIIMLTSRAGDKHRSKAFSLGVTDYMVKPYQDEVLIGTIRRLVAHSKVA